MKTILQSTLGELNDHGKVNSYMITWEKKMQGN